MSISAFQDKIFKSGCGVAVLLVSAAAMAAGLFYTSCGNDVREAEGKATGPAAVMVGDILVPPSQLDQQVQQMTAQAQMNPNSLEPRMQAMLLMNVLDQTVQSTARLLAAQQQGVDLSDTAITAFITQQLDKAIADSRKQLETEGKLKPNATEAEFIEAFKKMPESGGKSPADAKKNLLDQLATVLKDPQQRSGVIARFAPQMLAEKLKSTTKVTDAEIKASFDTFKVRRIVFPTFGKDAAEVEAQAKKALDEINSKKITFEQAMDRFSTMPMQGGKKPSSVIDDVSRSMIDSNAALKPLLDLKPGQVSGVIDTPEGKVIFSMVSVKNDAPKDFDKEIERYRDQFLSNKANTEIQRISDEIVKSGVVKFPLPGFEALYMLSQTGRDPALATDNDKMKAKLDEIIAKARAASKDDKLEDDRAAVLAWYAAFDELFNRATDKSALAQQRVEVLRAVLQNTESFSTRMELVDLGVQTKDAPLASQSLLDAARQNVGFDVMAEQNFREVNSKKAVLEKNKLISAEQLKELDAIQAQWRKDKAQNDKVQRELEAEQKKQMEQGGSATAPGAPSPTAPVPNAPLPNSTTPPGGAPQVPSGP